MASKAKRGEVTVLCLETGQVSYCSKQSAEVLKTMCSLDETDQRRFLKLVRATKEGRIPLSAGLWTADQIRAAADALP